MDAKIAKLIVEKAGDIGLELRLYERYSGRGMFGRETAGIVGDMGDIQRAMVLAAYEIGRDEASAIDEDEQGEDRVSYEDLDSALGRLKWDSLGRDSVCY